MINKIVSVGILVENKQTSQTRALFPNTPKPYNTYPLRKLRELSFIMVKGKILS